jgi:hypothetical protein
MRKCSAVENSNSRVEWRVEFRDASLPGYELESGRIELSRVFGIGSRRCKIMGRMELGGAKKISYVI